MTGTSKAISPKWSVFINQAVSAITDSQAQPPLAHATDKTVRLAEQNSSVACADPSSEELMDRVVNGDEKAFAELTRRHYPRSYAVAWRVLRDTGLAQDCVQEAFLRVWCKSHLWQRRTGGSFAAWLMRITTNLAIDEQRRPSQQERFSHASLQMMSESSSGINLFESFADSRPNPEQMSSSKEIGRRIADGLATLPPRQCQAFILCQIDGQSNAEAANIMGISVGALELLLVRARRSLRENLADLYQLEHESLAK
ncbi:MAG: sigma-70 family RNA polymerase sigma factor [Alphaproteobacteria bacterium]|nr:sigma-70 family RNA polymerase sigma factor [Alphaproteobacteria bacterium]